MSTRRVFARIGRTEVGTDENVERYRGHVDVLAVRIFSDTFGIEMFHQPGYV